MTEARRDPTAQVDVHVTVDGDTVTAVIVGDLDARTALSLQQALEPLVRPGIREVVLDLGGVGFLDSSGLAVLIAIRRRLDGGRLRLAHVSTSFRRLLEVTGAVQEFVVDG